MKYLSFLNSVEACIWTHKGCLCGSSKDIIKSGRIEHEKEYFCFTRDDFYSITEYLGGKKVCKLCIEKKARVNFYNSQPWKELRYSFLKKNKSKCMCCGRSPKENNIILHVDHIKPRSKYPELELEEDNLQVLCGDCNFGKLNTDETDWRST